MLSYGWTRSVNSSTGWREEQTGCILWTKFEKCKYLILFHFIFSSQSVLFFCTYIVAHGQQEIVVIFVQHSARVGESWYHFFMHFCYIWFELSCLSNIQFKWISLSFYRTFHQIEYSVWKDPTLFLSFRFVFTIQTPIQVIFILNFLTWLSEKFSCS